MQECQTRPQALHSCRDTSLFWRILRLISCGGNMRHFILLPCCWGRCLEGTFTHKLPFTHSPVLASPFQGYSGTVSSRCTGNRSGAAKLLLACGREKPREKLSLQKEMSSLEFFHFKLCFAQATILDLWFTGDYYTLKQRLTLHPADWREYTGQEDGHSFPML